MRNMDRTVSNVLKLNTIFIPSMLKGAFERENDYIKIMDDDVLPERRWLAGIEDILAKRIFRAPINEKIHDKGEKKEESLEGDEE